MPDPEGYMSPDEAAGQLGVSPKTIALWCERGNLPFIVLASGHRRIPVVAVDAYHARLAALKRLDEVLSPGLSEADVVLEILERRQRRS